ncbi:MAG: hypothetical protein NTY19_23985 [Planctomycetota bacterium]|nr:hypothetical protein [Planctomycetota bacterium]
MSTTDDTPSPETVSTSGEAPGPGAVESAPASPWRITAIGNRPHDHLVRDNLFGSLIRDHRGQVFQALLRRPPDWMSESVKYLPEPQRRTALQVVALNFLHQRLYANFLASAAANPDASRIPGVLDAIQRAQRCWPVGVLLEPGPGLQPTERFVCKQAYLCPWCHGRRVNHLYGSLRSRFAEPVPFRWLLQIRLNLSIDNLPQDAIDLWYQHMNRRDRAQFDEANFPWLRVPIYYVHDEIKKQLRDKIARLQLKGGILTYQLGPDRSSDERLGFSHRLGLLGEITFESQAAEDAYFGGMSPDEAQLYVCGRWLRAEFIAVPTTTPQALRFLLAGSSVNYPVERLGYKCNLGSTATPERGVLHDGVPGVLALQPLYLLDDNRLHTYAAAMTGIHLYDRFGSWRVSKPVEPPSLANLRPRQHRASRRRRLQTHNDQRQQQAADKRAAQLEIARTLWPQVQQQAARQQRGRPPYRQVLTQLLQQQGVQASDRDVRWLLQMLNPPATETVDTVDTDTTATDTTATDTTGTADPSSDTTDTDHPTGA